MLEGKEREQEIENLFEKLMTENFPNLVKEIDIQLQEAQRVPTKLNLKRPTSRHILLKMPKVKDKERLLKAARKKAVSYLPGNSHNYQVISQQKVCRQEGMKRNIQSDEKQGHTNKITLPRKAII